MKNTFKLAIACLMLNIQLSTLNAQIAINSDGSAPDASAMLEVTSSDKGILIPRMTTAERTAITSPATGLMVYDNDENSFWYYNGTAWAAIGGSGGAFTSSNGITTSNNNSDDFVFGADSVNRVSGASEYKMFFDKSQGAFRAGYVTGDNWNEDNIGAFSFVVGKNGQATGNSSVSFSNGNASGDYSTAFAYGEASGAYSTSFGESVANGVNSTAFGYSDASGDYSTAFSKSDASGKYSTAFNDAEANGDYSTAFGKKAQTESYGEFAIGFYNTNYTANSTSSFDSTDRLFVIGNGTSSSLSDAMIIYKNGNTELNGSLTIDNAYTFPTTDGNATQVLMTDGNGSLNWTDISSSTSMADADNDTKIQVEESSDEDIIRFDLGGTEFMRLDSGRIEILNTGKSVFIGEGAGQNDDFSDNRNVLIGYQTGNTNTTGADNSFIGSYAGNSNTTGSSNSFIGSYSGNNNTTGKYNSFVGYQSGAANTTGNNNAHFGYLSGFLNTTGSNNSFFGYLSGFSNSTGSNNVFLGNQAGNANTIGSSNIFIGFQAGYTETGSDKLYIDNSSTTTPLIYGDFDNDSLQINGTLNINGAFTFPTTDGTDGQKLVTDGNGQLAWENPLDSQTLVLINDSLTISNGNTIDLSSLKQIDSEGLVLENGDVQEDANQTSVELGQFYDKNFLWQTFTAENTGILKTIGFYNGQGINSPATSSITNGTLKIFEGSDTSSTLLYEATISSTTDSWNYYDLSDQNISITSGNQYVLYLSDAVDGFYWNYETPFGPINPYDGGEASQNSSNDMAFSISTITGSLSLISVNEGGVSLQSIDTLNFNDGTSQTTAFDYTFDQNIELNNFWLSNDGGNEGISINDNGNTTLSGTLTIGNTYTLPATDGAASQILVTDGSGTLNWTDLSFTSENGVTHSNNNDDDFVVGADSMNYGSALETKMFFDKSKGAFRAGAVAGTGWDESNIGTYSTSFGINTIASGNYSTSFGGDVISSGDFSTSFGSSSTASGNHSTSFGSSTTASGTFSTSFGSSTTASGNYATSFGLNTTAYSYCETVLGLYSTTYTPNNTSGFDSDDRLFVIGNGANSSSRSDAMIVYKDGSAWIQGDLTVNSTSYTSDIRLKENISMSKYGLTDIMNIKVRDYQFKKDSTKHLHTGFLAQQLHTVFPHAVHVGGDDENINPWTVDYASLTPLLIKGMQEQQQKINELEAKNEKLKTEVAKINQQQLEINELKRQLDKVHQVEAKLELLLNNQ